MQKQPLAAREADEIAATDSPAHLSARLDDPSTGTAGERLDAGLRADRHERARRLQRWANGIEWIDRSAAFIQRRYDYIFSLLGLHWWVSVALVLGVHLTGLPSRLGEWGMLTLYAAPVVILGMIVAWMIGGSLAVLLLDELSRGLREMACRKGLELEPVRRASPPGH